MRIIVILMIFSLAVTSPLIAKTKKGAKHYGSKNVEVQQSDLFSPAERHRIRSFFSTEKSLERHPSYKSLPYGLQKKVARGKPLPPGWQKKLASGENLDYQLYRLGLPLPSDLLKTLPSGPAGTEIIQLENEIIRLHTASRTILDFFNLVQGAQ